MDLSEITPQKTNFKINTTDGEGNKNEVLLTLRPYTIGDESWAEKTFGPKGQVQEIFENMKLKEICRIVFHQLTLESKKKIMGIKFEDISEDGDILELSLKGPERIENMIGGMGEFLKLFTALAGCKGMSQPVLAAAVEEELKKKGLSESVTDVIGLLSTT